MLKESEAGGGCGPEEEDGAGAAVAPGLGAGMDTGAAVWAAAATATGTWTCECRCECDSACSRDRAEQFGSSGQSFPPTRQLLAAHDGHLRRPAYGRGPRSSCRAPPFTAGTSSKSGGGVCCATTSLRRPISPRGSIGTGIANISRAPWCWGLLSPGRTRLLPQGPVEVGTRWRCRLRRRLCLRSPSTGSRWLSVLLRRRRGPWTGSGVSSRTLRPRLRPRPQCCRAVRLQRAVLSTPTTAAYRR